MTIGAATAAELIAMNFRLLRLRSFLLIIILLYNINIVIHSTARASEKSDPAEYPLMAFTPAASETAIPEVLRIFLRDIILSDLYFIHPPPCDDIYTHPIVSC